MLKTYRRISFFSLPGITIALFNSGNGKNERTHGADASAPWVENTTLKKGGKHASDKLLQDYGNGADRMESNCL